MIIDTPGGEPIHAKPFICTTCGAQIPRHGSNPLVYADIHERWHADQDEQIAEITAVLKAWAR